MSRASGRCKQSMLALGKLTFVLVFPGKSWWIPIAPALLMTSSPFTSKNILACMKTYMVTPWPSWRLKDLKLHDLGADHGALSQRMVVPWWGVIEREPKNPGFGDTWILLISFRTHWGGRAWEILTWGWSVAKPVSPDHVQGEVALKVFNGMYTVKPWALRRPSRNGVLRYWPIGENGSYERNGTS